MTQSDYGYFDKENKEFVVTRPDTPLPWINYLGSEEYCAIISNTAGGYSFYKDPKERRITRYRYNNVPMDAGGRYVYVRDNKSKDYWSATWQPVMKDLKKYKYECRHGLGYTTISSSYSGIKTTTTYMVPLGEKMEIWMFEITNESDKKRNLSVFPFVEFCLWDALNDMTDYQYNLNIGETEVKNDIIYHLTRYRVEHSFFAYFACTNQKPESYDTQRRNFTGRYGSFANPRAVVEGSCQESIASGWSPVGAFQFDLSLKAGESKTYIMVLGYAEDKDDVKRVMKQYGTAEGVGKAMADLAAKWEDNLDKLSVQTEDEDTNLMVTTWNQYQCMTTFNWSRSASYYESGIGRGMGFRDSNQDTLGFVHMIPAKVKQRIIDLASTQFEKGNAHHQYSPLTKKGYGSGLTDIGYSDDHLWLIISVAQYIKETGDVAFLEERIPFESGNLASLYDHLEKAINFTITNLGPHGLPLMFFADWNDCLNLPGSKGRGESVMVAQMLVYTAKEMARLAEISGRNKEIDKYREIAKKMTDQINEVAWDGAWYVRAFTDDGKPVGSSKCEEGKIYLETQGWAVMSGVAEGERAQKCMDSVNKHLATKYGIVLLDPPYDGYRPNIGSITFYPPGLKENGAIFCHPNPWAMIAEAMVGRGDRAFKYYKNILPAAKLPIADTHKTEPYIYCQVIAGKAHKDFGEGKNSWLTGSACWNFVAASQWIIGVRADYGGLIVDPCIPHTWNGFEAKRKFRGDTYFITVRNPENVEKGVKSVTLDGKKIEGSVIPPVLDGKEHHVEVIMGA
ncbi:MAG: glycosyl transferase [Candidatus Margulisbacteria bacterium]|nr:glycosyl transferase [Candidatus Margulisiibacteriota bacterium]MBU1021224.1 glycosyl transferase [Candidatus Margulisiibacteriota bacterium]MBU1729830.1 glycosyl transferase [Candidatus Margulisiibacteriota bacterium]MBU1955331.1 glycosyl transferase [Candidatus Margulisiibacteriota bacterium]